MAPRSGSLAVQRDSFHFLSLRPAVLGKTSGRRRWPPHPACPWLYLLREIQQTGGSAGPRSASLVPHPAARLQDAPHAARGLPAPSSPSPGQLVPHAHLCILPVSPCVSPMSPPCPLAGCRRCQVPGAGPGSARGSSNLASVAGMEDREPRESYYRPPSGSPHLLAQALASQIQQIQHFPGPGQPLAPPRRSLRGRRGLMLSFPFDKQQTRPVAHSAAGSNSQGLKPWVFLGESPLHPMAGIPMHASLCTAPHHGGDVLSIPTGHLPEPPCLPGYQAAAPHPPAWGFSPFLSLFHQFVSPALLVTKVRH